jgi:ketosteroid isomerase-like protein
MTRTAFALVLAITLTGCGGPPAPKTAEEFIDAYRQAYRDQDVDTIMALQFDPQYAARAGVSEALARTIGEFNAAVERERIEREIATKSQWALAWETTTYVSERPHGDHLHVTVRIRDVPPMELVVLVRDGETLKIHPRPSAVD